METESLSLCFSEYKKSGLTVALGGATVDAINSVVAPLERATQVHDDRLAALYGYKAYDELTDQDTKTALEGIKDPKNSLGINVSIGSQKSVNAGYAQGKEEIEENSVTYNPSRVAAKDTLTLESSQDTNIIGSEASGNTVRAEVGGDLNIESLQAKETYEEKSSSSGLGISAGITAGKIGKAGITGSAVKGKIESDYESVTDQAGIYAGEGGFDINVGGNTDLKGAVIASEADAEKNKLSTDTLTFSDIENKTEYSGSSTGISIGTEKGITPNIGMPVSSDASSTTKTAISSGVIDIHSGDTTNLANLSRDTENASQTLAKIFDKKTVEERQELAKVFGEVAYNMIGDIALHYQKKKFDSDVEAAKLEIEASKAEAEGNIEQANSLREQAANEKARAQELAKWNDGGSAKIGLHALVGGVMATIGNGSFGTGALSAGINEALQNEINKLPSEWRSLGSAVIGTAVSEVTGGDGQSGAA
ncbi:MAG: hemagglutinin repeat-containing protein, partial [Sporomusa sp.]